MPFDPEMQKFADLFYEPIEGEEMPLIGDGKTYSRALGWQSPEGNFYGQERWVRDWPVGVVWDGEDYRSIEIDGEVSDPSNLPYPGDINPSTGLPYGPRQHFEMWATPRPNWPPTDIKVYDGRDKEFYYWDSVSQTWQLVEWFWSVDGEENLIRPGLKIGAAHILYYYDIKVMWNGYYWTRYKHSMIEDDEPWMHLPEGFIQAYQTQVTNTNGAIQSLDDAITDELRSRICEARLEFISKTQLALMPSIIGNIGALWVSGELLLADDVSTVETTDQVVNYSNGSISYSSLLPNTEYFVYVGNDDFVISKKLFLSLSPDINGRLGDEAPGSNARIVGIVETDNSGFFIREIDMSLIGKKVEYSQTYWEYSDYQLSYTNPDTLELSKIDGTNGLFYINGQLISLGSGKTLYRSDLRLVWNNGDITVDDSDIATGTLYHVYLANDSYEYNFNTIGDDGFPRDEGDPDYDAALDFRRRLFLSLKEHDHRLFDQQYPGYYARHIGQVYTDDNGYFKYAANISAIRQPTLNPTHLDGLAECSFSIESSTQFKVYRKTGTTGIVYVGGRPVQTYDRLDSAVHTINTSDIIYTYNELTPETPLSDSDRIVSELVGIPIHLYLANKTNPETEPDSGSVWGDLSKRTFLSLTEPYGGYLSSNWPGNTARWLATFEIVPSNMGAELTTNGSFTGSSGWTIGSGWAYNEDEQLMYHTSGTAALSQSIAVSSGMVIEVVFSLSEMSGGTISVNCGGASSILYSVSGNHSFFLSCSSSAIFEFVPSTDFVGKIDNVSVRQALSGNFDGSIFTNTILGPEVTIIDDSVLSTINTWSSFKIQQELNNVVSKITASAGYNTQQQFGIPIKLEYYDSTRIRIYSTLSSGLPCTIVFPDLTTRDIPSGGILKTVSGSATTFYYVYLYENSVELSTAAPDTTYERLMVRGSGILVGYVGLSATNALAGNWNTFSLYGETEKTWAQAVTTCGTTTLSLPGIVVAPAKSVSITRSGWSAAFMSTYCTYNTNQWGYLICTAQNSSGTCTGSATYNSETENWYRHAVPNNPGSAAWVNTGSSDHWWPGYGQPYMNQTSILNINSYSTGVYAGQITLTHSLSCVGVSSHGGYWHPAVDCYWQTCAGTITAVRQAGAW